MSTDELAEWTAEACAALELPPLSPEDQAAILDLARDVAHGVARPAAPLTAFVAGMAVGRGLDLAAALVTIKETLAGRG